MPLLWPGSDGICSSGTPTRPRRQSWRGGGWWPGSSSPAAMCAARIWRGVRSELAGLQAARAGAGLPPLLFATDQEGGEVSRMSPPLPSRPLLGESPAAAFRYGQEQGAELAALGIGINFAPVLDLKPEHGIVGFDPNTRIKERAISADPAVVAAVGTAYAQGLWSQGVLATAKHFPGLGSASGDTHVVSAALGLSRGELEARDWRPFRRLLGATPALLMVGHASVDVIDPGVPASLSRPLIQGVVRGEWGYEAVIVSDDMSMAAVYNRGLCDASVQALEAGVDLLLVAHDGALAYPVLDCLAQAERAGRLPDLQASGARLAAMGGRQYVATGSL